MSNIAKIILIIIIVLAGGAYYWYSSGDMSGNKIEDENSMAAAETVETSDTLPTGADASDATLEKDLVTVDAQMNAFASDNASVDSGVNDQSIEQSSL